MMAHTSHKMVRFGLNQLNDMLPRPWSGDSLQASAHAQPTASENNQLILASRIGRSQAFFFTGPIQQAEQQCKNRGQSIYHGSAPSDDSAKPH